MHPYLHSVFAGIHGKPKAVGEVHSASNSASVCSMTHSMKQHEQNPENANGWCRRNSWNTAVSNSGAHWWALIKYSEYFSDHTHVQPNEFGSTSRCPVTYAQRARDILYIYIYDSTVCACVRVSLPQRALQCCTSPNTPCTERDPDLDLDHNMIHTVLVAVYVYC